MTVEGEGASYLIGINVSIDKEGQWSEEEVDVSLIETYINDEDAGPQPKGPEDIGQ